MPPAFAGGSSYSRAPDPFPADLLKRPGRAVEHARRAGQRPGQAAHAGGHIVAAMARDEYPVRRYRAANLDSLYRVCLLTARGGGSDGTMRYRDPYLPGHLYAAPYALFQPSLAFVAADPAGIGGYIVGALDSRAFERRLDRCWWPRLRGRYREPPGIPAESWTPDQRSAYSIHHPWRIPAEVAEPYPSHLHINLLPRLQGRGLGRALMNALLGELRAQGSRGVHLAVSPDNHRAIGFYQHLGFTRLPAEDRNLFCMDLLSPCKGVSDGI
jgi:ribosomal protein S18 acetylase RimI-like enzyme